MISPLKHRVQKLKLIPLLMFVAAISGCVGPGREPLHSAAALNSNETIIVGRIELLPALVKGEQKIKGLNSGSFENKVFIIADEKYREINRALAMGDFEGRIEATLGENFFVRSSNRPFYILLGMMYLELGGSSTNRVYFPGGFKVAVKAEDKAVYIGTLQYTRNEFFSFTKITVVDDYERANAEFKKKFGSKLQLRKSLITLPKQDQSSR